MHWLQTSVIRYVRIVINSHSQFIQLCSIGDKIVVDGIGNYLAYRTCVFFYSCGSHLAPRPTPN